MRVLDGVARRELAVQYLSRRRQSATSGRPITTTALHAARCPAAMQELRVQANGVSLVATLVQDLQKRPGAWHPK